jgi:hypothetical protein
MHKLQYLWSRLSCLADHESLFLKSLDNFAFLRNDIVKSQGYLEKKSVMCHQYKCIPPPEKH